MVGNDSALHLKEMNTHLLESSKRRFWLSLVSLTLLNLVSQQSQGGLQMMATAFVTPVVPTLRRPNSVSSIQRFVSTTTLDNTHHMPELGEDGVYHILNAEQHANFLAANQDKLVVLKVFAPWCRACKGLEPKFLSIVHSDLYANLPIVFCDLTIQNNKQFVKDLGVLALPSIQFYVGSTIQDTFPCGPSKVPILKRKLAQFINANVDASTRRLKENSGSVEPSMSQGMTAPTTTAAGDSATESNDLVSTTRGDFAPSDDFSSSTRRSYDPQHVFMSMPAAPAPEYAMSEAEKQRLIANVPYFKDLSLADLDQVLSKAKLLTFEAGSILMREGNPGRTFYILLSGEVEICQQTFSYGDPFSQRRTDYLGSLINVLDQPGDYFGERSLLTGEPRAASIRASSERVTCLAFDRDDFPASCVLSGRTRTGFDVDVVNDKYGVYLNELQDMQVMKQIQDASTASQVRGSVNTPQVIKGVDTDDEIAIEDETLIGDDFVDGMTGAQGDLDGMLIGNREEVVSLLTRFQMMRYVSQCLNYISKTNARWGDAGIRSRRAVLIRRLPLSRRVEFAETFSLMDSNGDGQVSVSELKRVLESVGEKRSDDELSEMIIKGHDADQGDLMILTKDDFLGIMAEAEFYNLFRDVFAFLDPEDTGFVRAKDLDRALCGVRDLISDDRKSIIDVEDTEMLVDYEQFSRMLLGSALT